MRNILLAAAASAGVLAFSATGASADIACSGNVCWHTQDRDYPAESRVIVHPDDWHWGRHEHYSFREHEGRGYWRGRAWVPR
jgi:hypothetical protein